MNDPHAMRINKELAEEIGFQESVVFLQIEFLISISRHEFDGKKWTRQSLKALHEEHFPWWSPATLSRIVNRLVERNLVEVGHYNQDSDDRTQWFAIDKEGVRTLRSIAILQTETGSEPDGVQDAPREEESARDVRVQGKLQNETPNFQNETPPFQNEKCIYIETTEKEIKERSTKVLPKKVPKLSSEEALERFKELCESDPQGEKLRDLAQLLAEENKDGKVAATRVWREIGQRYLHSRQRHELSEEAWDYGFEAALVRGAANIGYVLKSAKSYRPEKGQVSKKKQSISGRRPKCDFFRPEDATHDDLFNLAEVGF